MMADSLVAMHSDLLTRNASPESDEQPYAPLCHDAESEERLDRFGLRFSLRAGLFVSCLAATNVLPYFSFSLAQTSWAPDGADFYTFFAPQLVFPFAQLVTSSGNAVFASDWSSTAANTLFWGCAAVLFSWVTIRLNNWLMISVLSVLWIVVTSVTLLYAVASLGYELQLNGL